MCLIGISELLGVIGLFAPGFVGIQLWVTVAAVLGLALVQIGALVVHTRDRAFSRLGLPAMMLLVAWGIAWVVASLAHGLGCRDRAYL
jgi:hypothetical protein